MNYSCNPNDNFYNISPQNEGLSVFYTFKKMALNNFSLKFDIINILII